MKPEVPPILRFAFDVGHRQIIHRYLTHGKARDDREIAHERALALAEKFQGNEFIMRLMHEMFVYEDPILQTNLAGVILPNPIVLQAGFDKNVRIPRFLGDAQGFGAVTVGTVTKVPYDGNPKPRIFDLPNSDGLINRMGFPGEGSDIAEEKLKQDNTEERDWRMFISVGASKPSFERGTEIEDFVAVAKQLIPYGDGQEQNISSPNTKGVRGLGARYSELASALYEEVYLPYSIRMGGKEIITMVKMSPDMPPKERVGLIRTGTENGVKIFVLGNTTLDQDVRSKLETSDISRTEIGGISGRPLKEKALENSHQTFVDTGGGYPIVLSGGIQTAEDIWNALTYGGATAVGIYTAFVRPNSSTPNLVYYLNKDLAKVMRARNMTSMEDFKPLRGKRIPFPKI